MPNAALLAAYDQLPAGEALLITAADVRGVIPDLFAQVCAQGNCSVAWYWPKLPVALAASVDNSLKFVYLLNDLGMDAVANAATIMAQRRQYMRFSTSYQSYAYQIIANDAHVTSPTISSQLWTWLQPFTPSLWIVLLCSLFFCGVVVFRLEGDSRLKQNDFTELVGHKRSWPIRSALSQAIFLVSMTLAGNPRLVPTTIPSRIFVFAKSFSIYIVMASYLANFAAKLATPPTAVQLITGFDAFAALGEPMCIRNSATYVAFTKVVYPQIQTILAGPDTVDVLNGVQNGTCKGGMVNEIELRYAFGEGDPNATFCGAVASFAPRDSPPAH